MLRHIVHSNRASNMTHAKLLALMMCMHGRLGRDSPIACLAVETLRSIADSFVMLHVVMQRSSKRCMSNFLLSPDVFWLTTHFKINEIPMPVHHCRNLLETNIAGDNGIMRGLFDQTCKPGPFAGNDLFTHVQQQRVLVHKHAYVLSNFQRYQDWYYELFRCCRRFSVQFMASDKDYTFLLFEPAHYDYTYLTDRELWWPTVDGNHAKRDKVNVLDPSVTSNKVWTWLCDLWGVENCKRYVRVRDIENNLLVPLHYECMGKLGLQIVVCGAEIDPDVIFASGCFNLFRKKIKPNTVLCL